MSSFIKKINNFFRQGNAFLILILVLVLLIGLSCVYVALFVPKTAGTGVAATEVESVDESEIVINDIYEGSVSIPKFNVDANTYDPALFTTENGIVSYSGATTYTGIDVSEHQGAIDWAKVKESGINYAFIRVGYRGYTRGKNYVDEQLANNLQGASENGIKIGLYYFSQAVTTAEAEEEAGVVLENIGDYTIDYPIVFDWEPVTDEGSRSANADGEVISDCANAFCNKISKAGYHAAVYMNKSQAYGFYNLDKISSYDFWIAEYQEKPSLYYDFTIWQYSDSGTLDGIEGTVDVNISFKDYTK